MARRLSIRQRLTLHALFTGFVMLCLSLVFLSSQWHESRAEKRILDSELAPVAALRDVERVLLTVHGRMQSVLLGHITAMAAQEQLVRARALIFSGWQDYRRQLSNWSQDPDETRLIENIENRLPELQRFLEQTDAAYRRDDHAELERLVNADWMALEDSFSSALANLSALQNHHVVRAREELAQSRQRLRLLFGTLLFAGVLLLSGFATGLSRYIVRRILNIEAALEEVAAGKAGTVPHHDGGTERQVQEQLLRQTVAQLKETNTQLGEAQSQLLQTEKLAGLGQLAGGIAHEINNPIGFIHSNLGTLRR